tara:strand:+ start:1418 stop:1642 length:225 start_codon:yes stop_codon:yes gene_type:complete
MIAWVDFRFFFAFFFLLPSDVFREHFFSFLLKPKFRPQMTTRIPLFFLSSHKNQTTTTTTFIYLFIHLLFARRE